MLTLQIVWPFPQRITAAARYQVLFFDALSGSTLPFALFGNDFNPGDRRSVRVRLSVIDLDGEDLSAPLKAYEGFKESKP